jgi:hypothetical protein
MPDDADELILKMQHLEAQARAQQEARRLSGRGKSLRSRAQQVAWAAQAELDSAEKDAREAEENMKRARDGGLSSAAAADLVLEAQRAASEARTRIVKARAKLNFALDQMDEADRREYEAVRAEARAEAHGQLADDPLFQKAPAAANAEKKDPSSSSGGEGA